MSGNAVERTVRLRGRAGAKQRKRRLEAENYLCRDCHDAGRVTVAEVVDHIVPLSMSGTDDDSNTRPLCTSCHRKRTAEQFGHRGPQELDPSGWPV